MTEETMWFDKVSSFVIDPADRKVRKVELIGTFTKSELLRIIEVMKDDNNQGTLLTLEIQRPVGCWAIGSDGNAQCRFSVFKKPNRFHRFMTKLLLGWEWIDSE